jgi:hypothetical protein
MWQIAIRSFAPMIRLYESAEPAKPIPPAASADFVKNDLRPIDFSDPFTLPPCFASAGVSLAKPNLYQSRHFLIEWL